MSKITHGERTVTTRLITEAVANMNWPVAVWLKRFLEGGNWSEGNGPVARLNADEERAVQDHQYLLKLAEEYGVAYADLGHTITAYVIADLLNLVIVPGTNKRQYLLEDPYNGFRSLLRRTSDGQVSTCDNFMTRAIIRWAAYKYFFVYETQTKNVWQFDMQEVLPLIHAVITRRGSDCNPKISMKDLRKLPSARCVGTVP